MKREEGVLRHGADLTEGICLAVVCPWKSIEKRRISYPIMIYGQNVHQYILGIPMNENSFEFHVFSKHKYMERQYSNPICLISFKIPICKLICYCP